MKDPDSIRQRTSGLVSLLIIIVVSALGLLYIATTVSTSDFLWFVSTFGERPNAIVVHCAGEAVAYAPGSPEFEALNASVNADLSGSKSYPEAGLSEQTQEDYWKQHLVLEVIYPQPVRLHVPFRYGVFDTLIYPVTGTFSQESYVFGRRGETVLTGVDLGDGERSVAQTLKDLGYTWEGYRGCARH